MSKFQIWLLRRIVRSLLFKGLQFQGLEQLFTIVREEMAETFYEDNAATTDAFLHERLAAGTPFQWKRVNPRARFSTKSVQHDPMAVLIRKANAEQAAPRPHITAMTAPLA